MTTWGDSKYHGGRCEGEEADESFFMCESVNKMLGHHRSVTGQHLERADLYLYLFKSSFRKWF